MSRETEPIEVMVIRRNPLQRRGAAGLMAALALAATVPGGTPPSDNSRGYRRSMEARMRRNEERFRNRESRMTKAEAKRARRRARNLATLPLGAASE